MQRKHGNKWTDIIPIATQGISVKKRKQSEEILLTHQIQEFCKDLMVGRDVIDRAINSTWQDWCEESTLVFWWWTPEYRNEARDRPKMFVDEENLPHYWRRTQLPQDELKCQLLKKKIEKDVKRCYIEKGSVTNLTGFFDVPKGKDDVRIVLFFDRNDLH
eukprot:7534610-Ditylum_brightwellii.AAC.2